MATKKISHKPKCLCEICFDQYANKTVFAN